VNTKLTKDNVQHKDMQQKVKLCNMKLKATY